MTPTRVLAAHRRAACVELALQGHSYQHIAHQVGYAHRGSVCKAITRALDERIVDAVDELRALESSRLDALQAALWDRAVAGDLAAVNIVLRIVEKRARLLGLYNPTSDQTDGSLLAKESARA